MRRSTDFTAVVRGGVRVRGGVVVLHHRRHLTEHLTAGAAGVAGSTSPEAPRPPLVGLVVGKSVGGSVVRHRVSRRLRAQLATRLTHLPPGSGTVVRALPEAAEATSATLARGLDEALARLAARR
jgi:ribonuclease P protein component